MTLILDVPFVVFAFGKKGTIIFIVYLLSVWTAGHTVSAGPPARYSRSHGIETQQLTSIFPAH